MKFKDDVENNMTLSTVETRQIATQVCQAAGSTSFRAVVAMKLAEHFIRQNKQDQAERIIAAYLTSELPALT